MLDIFNILKFIWLCALLVCGALFLFLGPHRTQSVEQRTYSYKGQTFFTASPWKFGVLSIMTLNLYLLYWFYRNWKLARATGCSRTNPIIMTILSMFLSYALFIRIERLYYKSSIYAYATSVIFSFSYFMICMIGLSDSPVWLISFFSFVPIYFLNGHAIKIEMKNPDFIINADFSMWDCVAISLGGTLLLLSLISFCLLYL